MSLQTSVTLAPSLALVGQPLAIGNAFTADSFALGTIPDGVVVEFGDVLFYDTANAGVVVPGDSGFTVSKFAGICLRQPFGENVAGGGFTLTEGDTVSCMQIGQVAVAPKTALGLADSVYVILTSDDPNYPVGKLVNANNIPDTTVADLTSAIRVLTPAAEADQVIKVQILSK